MEFPDLLKGLRNLSEDALEFFIRAYSPIIQAYVRKYVRGNDTEDATQEFFYHILKTNLFARFSGENEAVFMAFLLRCASNFAINWQKKEFNVVKSLESFDGDNPLHWRVISGRDPIADNLAREDLSRRLNQAICALDARYRGVIELKLLDYSNSEIAEILDEPLGSVNSWYTRGLQQLRGQLKDLHTDAVGSGLLT